MLHALYRPVIQSIFRHLIQDTFTIKHVLIQSNKVQFSLEHVELTQLGCQYLNSWLHPLMIQSLKIQLLHISCACVYFIPYRLKLQLESPSLVFISDSSLNSSFSPSASSPSPPCHYYHQSESSSALGMIISWIHDCYESFRVEIKQADVHFGSWRLRFETLYFHPVPCSPSLTHKLFRIHGLHINYNDKLFIDHSGAMEIMLEVMKTSSRQGHYHPHLHQLTLTSSEPINLHLSSILLSKLNQLLLLFTTARKNSSANPSSSSLSPSTSMDQATFALFETFI